MGGRRADANLAVLFTNVREILDAADVDEQRRLHQAQLHRRNQTVSAGENLCVFVLRQQRERFVERIRAFVIEWCCNHESLLFGVRRLVAAFLKALTSQRTPHLPLNYLPNVFRPDRHINMRHAVG